MANWKEGRGQPQVLILIRDISLSESKLFVANPSAAKYDPSLQIQLALSVWTYMGGTHRF